jgi:hypothetical protein
LRDIDPLEKYREWLRRWLLGIDPYIQMKLMRVLFCD